MARRKHTISPLFPCFASLALKAIRTTHGQALSLSSSRSLYHQEGTSSGWLSLQDPRQQLACSRVALSSEMAVTFWENGKVLAASCRCFKRRRPALRSWTAQERVRRHAS